MCGCAGVIKRVVDKESERERGVCVTKPVRECECKAGAAKNQKTKEMNVAYKRVIAFYILH